MKMNFVKRNFLKLTSLFLNMIGFSKVNVCRILTSVSLCMLKQSALIEVIIQFKIQHNELFVLNETCEIFYID